MIRLLLALGLALSFLTVRNSASMSRSYNNSSAPSAGQSHGSPVAEDEGTGPATLNRSGYIVASS